MSLTYSYCYGWDEEDRVLGDPMDEAAARALFARGAPFTVVAGEGQVEGKVPAYTLYVVSEEGEFVKTQHFDEHGSIVAAMSWAPQDGRLFLSQATEWLYPQDGEFHTFFTSKASRQYTFAPDGTGKLATRLKDPVEEYVIEEFSDVDVSSHWAESLTEFGDWDRFGNHER